MDGIVDSCPLNLTSTQKASSRLGCGRDKYGNDQYMCLPNKEKTGLVELCHNGIMGISERGYCLETVEGKLSRRNCSDFLTGCPDNEFHINEIYKYPACLRISTQHQCYLADPSCGNVFTTDHDYGMYNMTVLNGQTTALPEDDSVPTGAIMGSLVAVVLILTLLLIIARIVMKRRKKQKNWNQLVFINENETLLIPTKEESPGTVQMHEIVVNSDPEERQYGVIEAGVNDSNSETESERSCRGSQFEENRFVGDYNLWRTKVSDQFSTLTDDEVSVLFCFLCSDSGPPDFTDTEWLDMLNEIRQTVYWKNNPVTSEEAQQTLDRLQSRDFLWEDQDRIKEDIKDETMYKIASTGSGMPYHYSSYDTARVYLRSERYSRKPEEKCFIGGFRDYLLILRLQMNILTHVTMEDTDIYDMIYQILNIPVNIIKDNKNKREEYLMDLQNGEEAVHYRGRPQDSVQHVTWRYGRPDTVRSYIGLLPHNDIYIIYNKAYRKPSKYHNYPPKVKCMLYCLLLTEKYQLNVNQQSHKITRNKIRDRYFRDLTDDDSVNLPDEITETQNGLVKFISDDIRHDVMYAFVTECLVEDSDLEFFLTMASRDVISEYCRSWEYERSEGERCLYVPDRPEEMYNLFIDKLQLDIITHCTVSDRRIHDRISKRLNIPEEILKWDITARERFVESLRHGRVKMFRARGMIVGCAGAGKTTLLRRLQSRNTEDSYQPTETTVGLEVHEDLFEIKEDTLYDFSVNEGAIPVARFLPHDTEEERMVIKGIHYHSSRGTRLISMTDFAGQVAYYACHQVYLSRRAFYIVVVDMSKKLDEEVRNYHTDRHNPEGSLFHSWKYKDYFHFWLQSIQTYCDDGKAQANKGSREAKDSFHPVILVASHADKVQEEGLQKMFYEELENCLSDEQSLKHLISPNRYFKVECPPDKMSSKQLEKIECLRKCIVETVERMPQWGEEIPLKWANLEKVLNEKKQNRKRVILKQELKEIEDVDLPMDKDLDDGLQFLHEIGQIIYFSDEEMKDLIVVDVQWFVDAFKYIITDETHLARKGSKNVLITTGRITDFELEDIWGHTKDNSYIQHKDDILPFMDKLGLMIKDDGQTYYIPSMNRTDLPDGCKETINNGEKTSIMIFHFKTFLPHFFFFRLVVNCLKEWESFSKKLYKNAAFYKVEDASHYIAIGVNKTSIQLQVFTPNKQMNLHTERVKKIRETVEGLIDKITQTFHKQTKYEKGFSCQEINITDEDEEFFMSESDVLKVVTSPGKKQRPCPKHGMENVHPFDKHGILQFWL